MHKSDRRFSPQPTRRNLHSLEVWTGSKEQKFYTKYIRKELYFILQRPFKNPTPKGVVDQERKNISLLNDLCRHIVFYLSLTRTGYLK